MQNTKKRKIDKSYQKQESSQGIYICDLKILLN